MYLVNYCGLWEPGLRPKSYANNNTPQTHIIYIPKNLVKPENDDF